VSNNRTLENFKILAEKYFGQRKGLYELSACTLLVLEYTDKEEVRLIAQFISKINDKYSIQITKCAIYK
jgi:pyruvate-formate lyase-activating enzyme